MQEKPRIKLEEDKLNQIVLSSNGGTILSKNMIVLPKQTNKDGTTLDEVTAKYYLRIEIAATTWRNQFFSFHENKLKTVF